MPPRDDAEGHPVAEAGTPGQDQIVQLLQRPDPIAHTTFVTGLSGIMRDVRSGTRV
jgi:hypothetical protein